MGPVHAELGKMTARLQGGALPVGFPRASLCGSWIEASMPGAARRAWWSKLFRSNPNHPSGRAREFFQSPWVEGLFI